MDASSIHIATVVHDNLISSSALPSVWSLGRQLKALGPRFQGNSEFGSLWRGGGDLNCPCGGVCSGLGMV